MLSVAGCHTCASGHRRQELYIIGSLRYWVITGAILAICIHHPQSSTLPLLPAHDLGHLHWVNSGLHILNTVPLISCFLHGKKKKKEGTALESESEFRFPTLMVTPLEFSDFPCYLASIGATEVQ